MVNFNFSFDPGTSLQQMVGFEIAGRIWSSYLTDPIKVNLQVGVSSSLGSNVIGGALPGIVASYNYADYRSKLVADSTSADDKTAVNSLTNNGTNTSSTYWTSFDLFAGGTPGGTNSRQAGSTTTINMTRADAKAVGINLTDGATALDGYILFSDLSGQSKVSWNYDYTRSTSMASNSLDFLSTAVHEIGHVLGFVSGVDAPGWLDSTVSWGASATSYINDMRARVDSSTPLDLFRYSADSTAWPSTDFSYGSWGGNKYLSLDKGKTAIASFATGTDTSVGGSGEQASHWLAGTAGIMAPTLKTGTRANIGSIDLRALDVIGWNLASTSSILLSTVSTPINLLFLQTQAQQSLASRLGKTVTWLNANSTTAAQQLAKDGSLAVYTMAVNSQIYDLNRITPPTPGATASLTYNQLFQERGLFETIDELEVLPAVSIQPSLEALVGDTANNLNKTMPPTPGGTVSLIINLLSPNLNKITPPIPGDTPLVSVTPSSSLSQSVQALTTGASSTAASNSLLAGKTSYFYGSSKPVAYEGSAQSAQQVTPLSVLVNLNALL